MHDDLCIQHRCTIKRKLGRGIEHFICIVFICAIFRLSDGRWPSVRAFWRYTTKRRAICSSNLGASTVAGWSANLVPTSEREKKNHHAFLYSVPYNIFPYFIPTERMHMNSHEHVFVALFLYLDPYSDDCVLYRVWQIEGWRISGMTTQNSLFLLFDSGSPPHPT